MKRHTRGFNHCNIQDTRHVSSALGLRSQEQGASKLMMIYWQGVGAVSRKSITPKCVKSRPEGSGIMKRFTSTSGASLSLDRLVCGLWWSWHLKALHHLNWGLQVEMDDMLNESHKFNKEWIHRGINRLLHVLGHAPTTSYRYYYILWPLGNTGNY